MFNLDLINMSNRTFSNVELLRALLEAHIDVVAIGGDGTADRGFEFAEYAKPHPILVIPSVVVPTSGASRVFVIGVVDQYVVPPGINLDTLANGVRKAGGISVSMTPENLEEGWTLVDASVIHVLNGNQHYDRMAPVALAISEASSVSSIGMAYTRVDAEKPNTYAELKNLMDQRPKAFNPWRLSL